MGEDNSLLLQKINGDHHHHVIDDGGGGGGGGEITSVLNFSIFISVCSSFVGGCSYAYSAPVQSAIISDLDLSTADYSLFGSILTIGGLFGSILCGKITDYMGRKAVPVYIAEISPKNSRGGLVFMSQLMFFSGIASVLVGLVPRWRILALIAALPCVIQLLGLLFIPESPRWLANVGRDDAYEDALQWLRGKNVDIS